MARKSFKLAKGLEMCKTDLSSILAEDLTSAVEENSQERPNTHQSATMPPHQLPHFLPSYPHLLGRQRSASTSNLNSSSFHHGGCPFVGKLAAVHNSVLEDDPQSIMQWERRFLDVIKTGYKSILLASKRKRLSEWTLMNNITESIGEITGSQYALILKAVPEPVRLEVVGMAGLLNYKHSDKVIQYREPHMMIFPTSGSHAMFIQSFNENRPIISNEMSPRTDDKPGLHPDISEALCYPLRYGDTPVGQLILANRPNGYREEMLVPMNSLSHALGHLIAMYGR